MEQYLSVKNVAKYFGKFQALNNINFDVNEGEFVCILGPSGCGKTTLLRVIAGLESQSEGTIQQNNNDISLLPPDQRDFGIVFQSYALFPNLTVKDNISFGLKTRKQNRNEIDSRVDELLKLVGLSDHINKYSAQLSGGEQQRVALARALAPQPDVMLLDEPYSGLDARLREKIRDEVLHLLREQGCATLMVTHDAEEAMFMADKIVVMNDGRVLQVGSPDELYFQPVNSFVAGVFGELNKLNGLVRDNKAITPLVDFPVEEFASGTEVEVVIRPEALCLLPLEGSNIFFEASVVESRLLGRMSYIHLSSKCSGRDGENIHLHCKMPGRVLPSSGEMVRVYIDVEQTFVFEKNKQ